MSNNMNNLSRDELADIIISQANDWDVDHLREFAKDTLADTCSRLNTSTLREWVKILPIKVSKSSDSL